MIVAALDLSLILKNSPQCLYHDTLNIHAWPFIFSPRFCIIYDIVPFFLHFLGISMSISIALLNSCLLELDFWHYIKVIALTCWHERVPTPPQAPDYSPSSWNKSRKNHVRFHPTISHVCTRQQRKCNPQGEGPFLTELLWSQNSPELLLHLVYGW